MKKLMMYLLIAATSLVSGCVTLDIKPTSEGGKVSVDWSYPVFEFMKSW